MQHESAVGPVAEQAPAASERAYRFTKSRILDGSFPAGELISEGQVAAPLRMSRTPVREAFLQLQSEGLLKLFPKRGALVVPVSPGEVNDVLEARLVIESHALGVVAAWPRSERDAVVAGMEHEIGEQVAALGSGADLEFVDADRRFHTVLVRAGCGGILVDVYAALRDRQLRMNLGGLGRVPGRAERILAEHRALVAELRAGSGDGATRVLSGHLAGTRAAFLDG